MLTTGVSCEQAAEQPSPILRVPEWARDAVWYQIFVERFRNGDPSNDPDLEDTSGSWPHLQPAGWSTTPWTHSWYRQEDWAAASGEAFYTTVQLRRFGGDLQGVLDRIDYLKELGVTAVYFNPLNDAPSLHKYDARNYRHIDRNFGPDPDGDALIMEAENPVDPSTWRWTAADSLFLRVLSALHDRGMRAIIDVSWNHTGVTFWAWKDVVENQQESPYADWYSIDRFDDPATSENEFSYQGWAGVAELPEFRKVGVPEEWHGGPVEGDLVPGVKTHIFAVTRRWLDPNGDGDPGDGVDGFRLDVAELVPLGFWREFRAYVRSINPDAYLVGEIWWEKWPDKMMDPRPYLGDVFDAVMNYRWFMPTRSFFSNALPVEMASSYVAHLDSIEAGISRDRLEAMMNVAATHDSPRLSTSLFNPGRYKFGANPRDNSSYRIRRPDAATESIKRLLLVQQFTYYGAPHVWYGDEVGMWGADDPDNRKPMLWPDLVYDPDDRTPDGRIRAADPVAVDTSMLEFYRGLIRLRRTFHDVLARGDVEYLLADDDQRLLAYRRTKGDGELVVVFNASANPQSVDLGFGSDSEILFGVNGPVWRERRTLELPPQSAAVIGTSRDARRED